MIVSVSAAQDQELQPKKASLFERKLLAFYEEKQFQQVIPVGPVGPPFGSIPLYIAIVITMKSLDQSLKTLLNWAMFMTEAKDRKGEREKKEMFVK